jgi:hypothetical protein
MSRRKAPIFDGTVGQQIASGLVYDAHPLQTPMWLDHSTVTLNASLVRKARGRRLLASIAMRPPRGMAQIETAAGVKRVYFGDAFQVYGYDLTQWDFTQGFTGLVDQSSIGRATSWSFVDWGNWMLATNGRNPAVIAKDSLIFLPLVGTLFTRAEIFQKFATFVLAMNTSNGSNVIEWCNNDNVEDWSIGPAKSGGKLTLRELNGEIMAAAPLNSEIAVYGTDSMFRVGFRGTPFWFGYQRGPNGIGCVGKLAVCADDNRNYGVSRQGIWETDGFSYTYIDSLPGNEIREWLQDNVNWAQASKIVARRNELANSIEFCFPILPSTENNLVLRFDLVKRQWSKVPRKITSADQRRVLDNPLSIDADGQLYLDEIGTGDDGILLPGKQIRPGSYELIPTTITPALVGKLNRFDARFWTVNGPQPCRFSLISVDNDTSITSSMSTALRVDCTFYRENDLIGMIWESVDNYDHPLAAYATSRDYRNCVLSFRLQLEGAILPIDDTDGMTLTIEGRDAGGVAVVYYVRLWNYRVSGLASDARYSLNFNSIQAGFLADTPIYAGDIDRMFLSIVSTTYSGATTHLTVPLEGALIITELAVAGSNRFLTVGNQSITPHAWRMASGYDDSYNVCPSRILRNMFLLGYRGWLNHYVGMSHYFECRSVGGVSHEVDPSQGYLNTPCLRWHEDLARRCKAAGVKLIWSLSFEVLNMFCPPDWRQMSSAGNPALSGWSPPSAFLSPCGPSAQNFLQNTMKAFADIAVGLGMEVHVQMGEPWWWIDFAGVPTPYLFDPATTALYTAETGLTAPSITTMLDLSPSGPQLAYMDWCGEKLAASTAGIMAAVTSPYPSATTYILIYLPQVLNQSQPNAKRLNVPADWSDPAFDVLQLEEYDYVISGDTVASALARETMESLLPYPRDRQHYLSGFALFKDSAAATIWARTHIFANAAYDYGVSEVFVWAYPQILRDGYTPNYSIPIAGNGISAGTAMTTSMITRPLLLGTPHEAAYIDQVQILARQPGSLQWRITAYDNLDDEPVWTEWTPARQSMETFNVRIEGVYFQLEFKSDELLDKWFFAGFLLYGTGDGLDAGRDG